MTRRELIGALLTVPWLAQRSVVEPPAPGDLTALSIREAAVQLAARRITAVDLTDAYLARIGEQDPILHAFVTITADRARADARAALSVLPRLGNPGTYLCGIPIAHKDLFETAGIRTTAGSRLFDRYVPARDAAVVAAFASRQVVLLGKTNTHELGGGVTTINPFFGTTRNPMDTSRIPGGSSGGSAAAVAGRLAAGATGSDTGGSVRIPAAFCGCVGFKPTYGQIDTTGLLGACPTFDHGGVLARTAADAEIMFGPVQRSVVDFVDRPAGRLRIGVARQFFFDTLQPDVAAAIDRALTRFGSLGATIEDRNLPVDGGTMARVFDPIVAAEIWTRYAADWKARPEAFSPAFAEFFAVPPPSAAEVAAARENLALFQQQVDAAFTGIDVIVTPTVPMTAPPITGPIDTALVLRNTWPFNAGHTPAISIPCGTDAAGLPIGLQLAGRRGDDKGVLRAARLFEEGR